MRFPSFHDTSSAFASANDVQTQGFGSLYSKSVVGFQVWTPNMQVALCRVQLPKLASDTHIIRRCPKRSHS